MIRSYIYLDRDNSIDLTLYENQVIKDLAMVTRVTVTIDSVTIDSDTTPSAFDWTTDTKKLSLILGFQELQQGDYFATLVIYSIDHLHGIVWANDIPVAVRQG